MSKRIIELASSGVDEYLQGLTGDPFGGAEAVGLRVPTASTASLATKGERHRYLFLLASFSLGSPMGNAAEARILGYRQLVTIGKNVGTLANPRFVEQEVTTPGFRLPDGNVSFHIHRLGPPNAQGFPRGEPANTTELRSFKKNWSDGSALLYDTYTIPAGNGFYVNLTAYAPPNGGRPWGTPLRAGQQGTFYDLRTPWRTAHAWSSLDMWLRGPDTIAFFASVRQSAGAQPPAGISSPSQIPNAMPEEQFIAAFPGAIYWRVGGSLILEVSP
jgi:hypothetical protein